MGVYIKGMKKPKDCNACFLDLYDRQTYCRNGEKALCPLIEVTEPHGDLVDREEIDVLIYEDADGFHTETSAPTVIAAEGE